MQKLTAARSEVFIFLFYYYIVYYYSHSATAELIQLYPAAEEHIWEGRSHKLPLRHAAFLSSFLISNLSNGEFLSLKLLPTIPFIYFISDFIP